MAKRRSSLGNWVLVALIVVGLAQCFKSPSSNTSGGTASQQPTVQTTRAPPAIVPAPSTRSTSAPTPATASVPANTPVRYVTASTLNMRSGPTTGAGIVGKLPNGHAIQVIRQEGDWLFVDTGSGQGWVSAAYTSATLPAPVAAPTPASQPAALPSYNRDAVVQQIIDQSLRSYPGRCPCPYNRMSNGRQCGGNSAYSKPGGRSPICYPEQVTDAMIAAFLGR